jgi:hypothetical protein
MSTKASKRRRAAIIGSATVLAETAMLWLRTGRPGGNVIVRCRQGHLFTTIWIPLGSLKALRLGLWRVQRCPVGHHWSLVSPVAESQLRPAERRAARAHHDIRIP